MEVLHCQTSNGQKQVRLQLIGIECGTGGFCSSLPGPRRNQTTPEVVSKRTSQHCSRPESPLGESEGEDEYYEDGQTNNVSLGSSQDRGGSKGEMGQGQSEIRRSAG
jgi:hypothetical protein